MKAQAFDSSDYEFLRHEPCPECGSSDSVGVWRHIPTGGETKKCFSDKRDCSYQVTTASLYRASQKGLPLPDAWLKRKGLTSEVARLYRISHEGKVIHFGLATPDGQLKGVMGRNYGVPKHDEKHFFCKQNCNLLYGMDTCRGWDSLIIVSGYWDAPAARVMTGMNAVSLKDGDKSAVKGIKDNFQWLRKFKTIYICFDNDESGQNAATKALEILGYRAKNVVLPDYGVVVEGQTVFAKDASDYLVYGLADEFKRAIDKATNGTLPYVYGSDADDMYADYKLRGKDYGWSTGIEELDTKLKLRPNEFTLLFGAPGRGKSTIARHLVSCMVGQTRPYYLSLEDPIWVCIDNLVRCLLREDTPYNAYGECTLTQKELKDRARRVRELVSIAHIESCTPEILEDAVECAYVQYGCQFIVIDHITWLLNATDKPRETAVAYINIIAELCKKYPIHVLIISHNKPLDVGLVQNRNGKKFTSDWEEYLDPTPRDAQWSSTFEQMAWNILGWKNPSDLDSPARIHILKNRVGGMKNLGVVLCYFDEQTHRYRGVKQHAIEVSRNQRHIDSGWGTSELSLSTGENNSPDVLPSDTEMSDDVPNLPTVLEKEQSDRAISVSPDSSETRVDDNGNGRTPVVSEEVHSKVMEPGLHLQVHGEHSRVQRSDGTRVSKDCGDVPGSTACILQKIQTALSETGFNYARTEKRVLPGVGRTSRDRMGVFQSTQVEESRGNPRTLVHPKSLDELW